MIGKVCRRGSSARRLLGYLFAEGLAGEHGLESEHRDAHVIAGYEPADLLEPARDAHGRPQLTRLAALLDAPVKAGGVGPDAKPVYHLAISAAPGDRRLTDAEWADIVGQYVQHLGLAPEGDPDGVRWVAVRHAHNHVHVVATLVRQDGRRVFPHHHFYRAREVSLAVEESYGLTRTSPVDRTGVAETSRAEHRKHQAVNRARATAGLPAVGPDREVLRTRVRTALAGSSGWAEFTDRLSASGVLLRERYSTHTPDQLTGYAVALLPTGTRADQRPVWFGGGKLAPDLSLPQLQARWGTPPGTAGSGPRADVGAYAAGEGGRAGAGGRRAGSERDSDASGVPDQERLLRYAHARDAVHEATEQIRQAACARAGGRGQHGGDDAAQAAATAGSELLHVLGRLAEGRRGGPLTDTAPCYDRAARPPHRRTVPPTPTSRWLRTVAGELLRTRIVKRAETAPYLALLEALIRLAVALAALRQAQQQAAQATAARHAAEQLLAEHQRRAAALAALFAPAHQHPPAITQPAAYRPPSQPPRRSTSR